MNPIRRAHLRNEAWSQTEAGKKLGRRARKALWAVYILLFVIVPIVAFIHK